MCEHGRLCMLFMRKEGRPATQAGLVLPFAHMSTQRLLISSVHDIKTSVRRHDNIPTGYRYENVVQNTCIL